MAEPHYHRPQRTVVSEEKNTKIIPVEQIEW